MDSKQIFFEYDIFSCLRAALNEDAGLRGASGPTLV